MLHSLDGDDLRPDVAPEVAVVGAGPAGLMAAERLAASGCAVTVFEAMPSVARKFLLAGRGGLNLTHSEPAERMLGRYGEAAAALRAALDAFSAQALTRWCEGLGVETFVGTSGRVFPKSLKTSPLLRAWLGRLGEQGVEIETRRRWTGFADDGGLVFDTPDGPLRVRPAATVIALGGASWPRLGSDAGWVEPLGELGVDIAPLRPANCGFLARWSEHFVERFAGEPIKRAALSFEGETARGEAMVTRAGIEGGLIYALSRRLREAIDRDGEATPLLDLRPDLSLDALSTKLAAARGSRSLSTHLRKAAYLSPVAIALLRELGPREAVPEALARAIKALPLRLTGVQGLDRAISTAGGVRFAELDERFMLKRRPGVFLAGEMLDWEAPTGGYLLQATFATAVAAAQGAAAWAGAAVMARP
ncbi:TIGR03862 family flavoprotein [Hansschlegelia plantiphila]|uniref:NAD(FAD)-utilizing dehydrogenase n=1 Tax=Hansschlegelia plantiphila TaxID=374655 RepID=A0A9W6J054_9HYPH|nr:TIGR03862 family flavoprotein [Hansschlegelia plantiphila]GLK66869.1 NAD(FAD)-utilizing dehydrogenase [Hansschlegelia plantiphila]